MSTTENSVYQETVWEMLQEAFEAHDFDRAERIIEASKSVIFPRLSEELYKELATAKADYQANQTPDDNTNSQGLEY